MLRIDRPAPDAETPRAAARRFRRSVVVAGSFVVFLCFVLALDAVLAYDLRSLGVRPGEVSGLVGLLTLPLIHGGAQHLMTNMLPLFLLGSGLLYFYPASAPRVLPWFWLVPGLWVWITGEAGSIHFGASGLNFALLAYLALGGLLRRAAATLALSLVVAFYYGSMLGGILPLEEGVSWESHLGGFLVGMVLAVVYRHLDVPPRKRYDWEDEDDEAPGDEAVAGDSLPGRVIDGEVTRKPPPPDDADR